MVAPNLFAFAANNVTDDAEEATFVRVGVAAGIGLVINPPAGATTVASTGSGVPVLTSVCESSAPYVSFTIW